ncbi:MAG: SpoIIE family protein phosphatase [Burkholderiales bacterium]|nr:SpoIIE family protein phosphatase [Burkholderiales bacterium]
MSAARELRLRNDFAELRRMSEWLADACAAFQVPQGLRFDLDIAANEAVTNIISYGFENSASHQIVLRVSRQRDRVAPEIDDDGRPFDPLRYPEPATPASLEEAPIGGLGVKLMRGLIRDCRYERRDGRNRLVMAGTCPMPQGATPLEPSGEAAPSRPRGSDRRRRTMTPEELSAAGIAERRSQRDRRRAGFISASRFLSGVPYHLVEDVLARCSVRNLNKGDVLLAPGQMNDCMHLLQEGQLRIHLDSPDSGDFIPVQPVDCIGELSILDGKPVSAYVVAHEPSRVLAIHESVFWEVLLPIPEVAKNLFRVLSERMRLNNELILQRMKDHLVLEQLRQELRIARSIQSSMLPAGWPMFPGRGDVDICASMDPAEEVGGDFYDAFFVGRHRLFLAVGDVSGKGVPAALFMARAMTVLRTEALRGRPPHEILDWLNASLCENNDASMFVTILCGLFDTRSGRFTYSNAGHNPPYAGRAGGYYELPVPRGPLAGIDPDARFSSAECRLARGDTLVLYTDGVPEAMDAAQRPLSEGRLVSLLQAAPRGSARDLVEAIRAGVAGHVQSAARSDDITLMVLRHRG